MNRKPTVVCVIALVVSIFTATPARAQPDKVDFSREIQPLFARHCYKCHGPNNAEGGLRLSDQESAKTELDSGGTAIVSADPKVSILLQRVRSEDEDVRMPPEGKGLSADETALLERWIKQGAKWADHWSFQTIVRPIVPTTKNTQWPHSPIDSFILRQLEAAELAPSAPADKLALVRRVYFDLIGLPPTPAQIDAFVDDDSPAVLEKLIDQLLATDQYGEKWARHWLDLVRYAETNGYERDSRKDLIWKYRDYVIDALNEDKPYDRFILEQLAGDELEDLDAESITATGYYRLGIWDDEPADRELARYDYLDDIVRTTGEGMLGITIGCARCHNHKIDPILQSDYYSMLSFFSDISNHGGGAANHVPIAQANDRQAFEKAVADKKTQETTLAARIRAIEQQLIKAATSENPDLKLTTTEDQPRDAVRDSIKSGQTWRHTESNPGENWFQIAFDDSKWKASEGGFGTRGTPGSVVRTEWRSKDIWLRKDFRLASIPKKLTLKIHHDEDAEVYLNGKQIASLSGYVTKYQELDVTPKATDVIQTGRNTLAIHCRQTGGGQYIDAGLYVEADEPIATLMRDRGSKLLGATVAQEWSECIRKLAESQAKKLEFKPEFAMAVTENGQRKTWILQRGLPALKGDEVGPGYPIVLNPPDPDIQKGEKTAGKRVALARWIASKENPLTSRVIVNRVWQHHFGRGIVRTSSDFGYQGTPPTHPELLDWLAVEFVKNGWSLKELHKTIMLSRTYQMSSTPNHKALAVDPENDLFWRYNMRRLNAEEIRDSILAVTGTLNRKMHGPPIFPKLSREVLATSSRPSAAWGNSSPQDAARRTIYIHVKRSLRPPMLANFDVPDTDSGCAVRLTTTVPTQALGMLNSEFMNSQAERLAERLKRQAGDKVQSQVSAGIRLLTGRVPSDNEIQADVSFIHDLQVTEKLTADRALSVFCLMLLNTNEFVYVD